MPAITRRQFCLALGGSLLAARWGSPALAQQASSAMLLVASSRLGDPQFRETVVLVTRHGRSRPMGVILNRPMGHRLGNALGLPDDDARLSLYQGGPVSPARLVYLFQDQRSPGSAFLDLGQGLYFGFTPQFLAQLLQRQPTVARVRLFLGFASWGPGQLEREIERGDWLVVPLESDHLFSQEPSRLWPDLIRQASEQVT